MTGKVIQGSFVGGQPRWSPSIQAKIAPSSFQPKIVAPPHTAFAGPRTGAPAAPAARPSTPPGAAQPAALQRHAAGGAFAVGAGALGIASGGGRPLPNAVRGKMEAALGADFSNVRVHVGPQAERIGAIAFTVGSDLYFAPGRYQPDTQQGQQLLGHELAHVVQQRQGRVRNPLGSALAVVQDRALEAEADRLGRRAATYRVAARAIQRFAPARFSSPRPAANLAQLTRYLGRTAAIQAQLSFDTDRLPQRWAADSSECSLCFKGMGLLTRHHCRVCGQSVCGDCSKQKFLVRNPQTSEGKDGASSEERVCVDCILNEKITRAEASSTNFKNLKTRAQSPGIRWENGGWPHHDRRTNTIWLNPTRGDPFATYVFELHNAIASLGPRRKATDYETREEYAEEIERREYEQGKSADAIHADINARQNDFKVARVYAAMDPTFEDHLERQKRGGHTQKYYDQWTEAKKQQASHI
jgi:hypothetical protein